MTGADLKGWRDRLGLSNEQGAAIVALGIRGFLNQLYGRRPVSPQTERLCRIAEDRLPLYKTPEGLVRWFTNLGKREATPK
jgi:hypothetical protein